MNSDLPNNSTKFFIKSEGDRVIRGCKSFDSLIEFFASCQNPHPAHIVKPDYCGICETDGCNGANQFGPLVFLIGFPVAIAFIFQNLQA